MTIASDPQDADLTPLLSEPFAEAWPDPAQAPALHKRIGERLGARLARSLQGEQGMVTVRRRNARVEPLSDGVVQRLLYRAPASRALRAGEPRSASLVELQPGACLTLPAGGAREFLVTKGELTVDGEALGLRDFLLQPAGQATTLHSANGALVFVREAEGLTPERTLVRDAEAGWPEFAPGIRRRVLWAADGQAALLYRADPGAQVPHHAHGHDEECLLVQGELYLDDVLLQPSDYQLAPVGTGHLVTETETGVVLYAHGDLDLQFR